MLNQAEKEIIYSALYISINFYKFKNFVKINKPSLYEIIKDIRNAEIELSKTEQQGNIGTIDDHIRWMIIHYNAKHTKEPEVQGIELWRPPQKKIV